MFGYLTAAAQLLDDEQNIRYRECYCGLCRSLGSRLGTAARLTLNYDMTFLVLLLSSLYEPEEKEGSKSCMRHPAKENRFVSSEIIDYAADMNTALACYKCLDDWQDEHKLTAYAAYKTLGSYLPAIKERYPRQCDCIESSLRRLSEIEKAGLDAPDEAADCFGTLMEELFVFRRDRWETVLRAMAHALGRFIYLLDAAMDLDDDRKSGSYNPFSAYYGASGNEERFRDILKMQLGECIFHYDRLPLVSDIGLIQNILCIGLWVQFNNKYSRKDP